MLGDLFGLSHRANNIKLLGVWTVATNKIQSLKCEFLCKVPITGLFRNPKKWADS